MSIRLTKVDAARRQLATAIRLFFNSEDSVSVFSLAANAWEVVDSVCTHRRIASMSAQARTYVAPGKDLKKDYINSPFRNFFKHADRDPEAVLEQFEESALDGVLFLAVEDYIRLCGRSPVEFQVFQLWYLVCHPEKVANERLKEVLDPAAAMFPEIAKLSRYQQIASGQRALAHARTDQDVLNDPRTESAY